MCLRPCAVQEVAAAGLLEATAADFGLSHQHVTVEAVRTQDWEQSIKVGTHVECPLLRSLLRNVVWTWPSSHRAQVRCGCQLPC